MSELQFYTYLYLRKDETPYYVGKGSGRRVHDKRRTVHMPVDNKRVHLQYHASEQEAFAMEKALIAKYGRKDLGTGILRNRTDGGEGTSGRRTSDKTRKAISDARKGMKFSAAHKRSIAEARTGTIASLDTKEKMSRIRLGKRINMPLKGPHSAATKARIKKAITDWWARRKHAREIPEMV